MVDEQRTRVETAMAVMMDDIDKSYLRGTQAEMHRCAVRCCESRTASVEGVQRCVYQCSLALQSAQNFVQNELDHLQDRLKRCIMSCNDGIRDQMGSNPTDSQVARYTGEFERCATKCVDAHIEIIPGVVNKIKDTLRSRDYSV